MATYNSTGSGGFSDEDATWAESSPAGQPGAGDHAIITAGDTVTLRGAEAWGSVDLQGTLAGGGQTLTLNDGGDAVLFEAAGAITGTLDVLITGTTSRLIDFQGSSGYPRNLTITPSSGTPTFTLWSDANNFTNLTINSGATLDTSGSNYPLTVTGNTSGTGTLALNNSTYTGNGSGHLSMTGTVTIGTSGVITGVDQLGETSSGGMTLTCTGSPTLGCERWRQLASKWTPATSTIKVEDASNSFQDASYGVPYNFEIDNAGNTNELANTFNVTNNLTITAGTLDTGSDRALTVGGDVSIANGATLTGNASAISMRSLGIADGATYNATSGTTTIVDRDTATDYAWKNDETDGTGFVHNNGTVKFTSANPHYVKESKFYNVELALGSGTAESRWLDITGNLMSVFGNLTITTGEFELYTASDSLIVHGLTNIGASGKFNNNADQTSGSITHHGLVTNLGTYKTDPITNNFNGGFRQLGTFVSNDTLTIGGTGGILEGNLDDAIFNVNTDSVLDFDGVNDYITVPDDNTLDFDTGDFTVTAWAYAEHTGGKLIVSKQNPNNDANSGYLMRTGIGSSFTARISDNDSAGGGEGDGYVTGSDGDNTTEGWHHYAMVVDKSGALGTANRMYRFVDGELHGTATNISAIGDVDNSEALQIGRRLDSTNGSNTGNYWEGGIADVRIYDAALSAANVQVLASKINGDSALGAGTGDLDAWWKLNEGTGTSAADSSANTNTGTLTNGPAWVFDAFSVNVQGQTVAGTAKFVTDGTMTVTQGKLEGLSLTSLDFEDTSSDYVTGDDADFPAANTARSISAWIKPADVSTANQSIFGYGTGSTYDGWQFDMDVNKLTIQTYGQEASAQSSTAIVASVWQHVMATYDGTTVTYYLNGVADGTATFSSTPTTALDVFEMGRTLWSAGRAYWDGGIRDVRLFDYALSADQASSLYSGSYNVTPKHHWKLDDGIDGTATTTAADSGTGTTYNGTLTNFTQTNTSVAASDWISGTLDLDSTLTIAANGLLSAPRGTLNFGGGGDSIHNGEFNNSSTIETSSGSGIYGYKHNDGTFVTKVHDAVSNSGYIQRTGTVEPVFYNLSIDQNDDDNGDCQIDGNITVENSLKTLAAGRFMTRGYTTTIGTATSAGDITTAGVNDIVIETGTHQTFKGVNSLNPCEIKTNMPFTFGAGSWKFSDVDFQMAVVTGGGGATLTLTGDCEFDGVTISSEDTLDINGQRVEFGGVLTMVSHDGTDIKSTGGGLIIAHDNVIINGSFEEMHDGDVNMIVDGGTGHDWRPIWGDGTDDATIRNILINGNVTTTSQVGHGLGDSDYNPESIIVGSGTFTGDAGMNPWYLKDLTIATGGTATAGSRTIGLHGDFTTSGGLLGASALHCNRSNTEYMQIADHADLDFANSRNDLTLECWFKTSNTSDHQFLFDRRDGVDVFHAYIDSGTNSIKSKIYSDGGATELFGTTTVNDGKWHHYAATFSGAGTHSLYIDGKLEAQEVIGGTIPASASNMQIGVQHTLSGHWMDGYIDEVRMFAAAKTVAQIREDMFKAEGTALTHYNSLADASTDGLIGRWSCNAGTGSSVVDGGSPAALTTTGWAGAGDFDATSASVNLSGTGTVRHADGTINLSASTGNLAGLYVSNSAIFNLNGYNLNFGSGATWEMGSSTTLSGTGSVAGNSSTIATTTIPSGIDAEVVGNASYLAMQSGSDLTVVGNVTGCTFADSTANIRQWHHTLDTQQLLDADEAGDDDLRLTKPALDNAHELMTG